MKTEYHPAPARPEGPVYLPLSGMVEVPETNPASQLADEPLSITSPGPYGLILENGVYTWRVPQAETILMDHFPELVGKLSLTELLVPAPYGKKISRADAFRLAAVTPMRIMQRTLQKSNYYVETEPGIRLMSPGVYNDGRPCLDTAQAIGLVFDDSLIAVAGAGVDLEGRLRVQQLQDVTGVNKGQGSDYYKTGLHNGFLWRDTLVRAWEELGGIIGVETAVVQSHQNNKYDIVQRDGYNAYDAVAQRLGYYQDSESKDWIKTIS